MDAGSAHRRTGRAWFILALTLPFLAAVTWLDAACFFEIGVLLRWLAVTGYLVVVARLATGRGARAIAGVAVVWMVLALPEIRWNETKSFFVDARRIRAGMPADEVRGIMSTWFETGALRMRPEEAGPEDRLVYYPYADSGDDCEVRFDARSLVRAVRISKD